MRRSPLRRRTAEPELPPFPSPAVVVVVVVVVVGVVVGVVFHQTTENKLSDLEIEQIAKYLLSLKPSDDSMATYIKE